MGSGASSKKYQGHANIVAHSPELSEEPAIQNILRKTITPESNSKTSASLDSMQVNTSHDDIAQAVGRVRIEAALAGPGRVLDLMTPTPPHSPVPTGRTHRSGSGATERLHGAAGGHSSPQADFIIDGDSGQFDDESPSLNTADINDFLNWQRQQTVSVMKNAQLEKEVAELEKQLRQMDMLDGAAGPAAGSTAPQRLPSVEKSTVVGARVILSRERPSSGAAVMPDPTALTTHRDDSYTPSGNSSRQSSRGLVKAALRNANSASALEAPSAEHLRHYQPSADRKSSKMMVSPPPSPPPPDPEEHAGENPGMDKTREIEHYDSGGNDVASEVRRHKQRPDRGENDQQHENVLAIPKSDNDKPVMRFEQRPHNTHHRRHIGHKRNNSDNSVRRPTADSSKEDADSAAADGLPVPKGVEASAGQGSLALLNKKHKDKDKDKVVVTRRRRTIDEKGHLGEERPVLPDTEVKRLLVPVGSAHSPAAATNPAQAVAPNSGGKGRTHHHHHPHPKISASLSPLHQHVTDDTAHDSHDEGSSKFREKPSGHLLAPLNVVPAIKGDESEGRVPLLPVGLVKDRGRNNSVLQGVNRRRTRASTDENPGSAQPSAAAAYLQAISPREGDVPADGSPSGRGHVDKFHTTNTNESVTISGRLSNRINSQPPAASDAIPPLSEPSSQKGAAVRRRRERSSSDNLHSNNDESEKLSKVADSNTAGESSDGRTRVAAGAKRSKRKSFGGNAPLTEAEAADSPPNNSGKSSKAWSIDIASKPMELDPVSGAASRPWSQTMELRLGEVEFMLRKPVTCDGDISSVLQAATDGLVFMDELNSVAKSLDMLRGSLSRWLLPYDNNTRIDEQCSNVRTVVDNMPDYLVGKLTERQVNYLVTAVNKVRQLVRVKIADDNDLEQARTALESTATFFQRLVEEARIAGISPYALFSSKRV